MVISGFSSSSWRATAWLAAICRNKSSMPEEERRGGLVSIKIEIPPGLSAGRAMKCSGTPLTQLVRPAAYPVGGS